MVDMPLVDYSALDRPEVLNNIFHPRQEWHVKESARVTDLAIPVGESVTVGARFHLVSKDGANILFFHGNGEIVSDYDDLGPFYNRMGINFLPVDYRGYGRSGGSPSVSSMMRDCVTIYEFAKKWLAGNGYSGPFIVMGRSLGSASALELVRAYPEGIDALIVESGFAYSEPLLRLLGVDLRAVGFQEEKGFRNLDKIRDFRKPVLIIHAEYDHIIPFTDGRAFFEASPSADKTLLKIPGANHNDIFSRGLAEYMAAVKSLTVRVAEGKR
ncbi:MAG: alpha/beta hydrolase [Desulfobacteraceae bacterium]|nr:alpha/beta hydrolase [Desulfobacteraceae bacterium]